MACFIFLFHYLGFSFLAGIGVFIVSFIIQYFLANFNARYQREYMKRQDKRVGLTTEGLNNIKMIKLYSWIDIFTDMIAQKRLYEFKVLKTRLSLTVIIIASLYFFPSLLQAVSLTTFLGTGGSIDIETAFAVITIFNIIASPLRMLPLFIGNVVEFHVSVERIQKFLNQEEIN